MSSPFTRQDLKTVGVWTLQRREFGNGEYDYRIATSTRPVVELHVNDRPDFKTNRMVYTVEYSPRSSVMDLEEAAEFVAQAEYALVAATEFQQAIDAAEGN